MRLALALLVSLAAGSAASSQSRLMDGGRFRPRAAPQPRLLFVWDNDIPGDVAETALLFQFAADHRIQILAVECSPVGYSNPGAEADYLGFVTAAHALGLQVFALCGNPWFTVPNGAGIPGQPTGHNEGWDVYATVAASAVPFDGVVDDSEPYSINYLPNHNYFWENLPLAAQQYLDWLAGIQARIGALPLYGTTPYWYDDRAGLEALLLDGEATPHPLSWYAARHTDVTIVLAYRDFARGAGGIIDKSLIELRQGPVMLGVLAATSSSNSATFWEEGKAYMEGQLDLTFQRYASSGNFQGFAFHKYRSYQLMAP